MSEENDDKPFEASEQKLRRAREKGDIPRSPELNVAAMYLGAWLAFAVGAGLAVKAWLAMATYSSLRWLISITERPLPCQSSISAWARCSTAVGSAAGPALKL